MLLTWVRIVVLVLLISLSGCKGDNTTADNEPPSLNTEPETPPADEEVVNKGDDTTINEAGFPQAFYFRVAQNKTQSGYEEWAKQFGRLNGIVSKVGFDELYQLKDLPLAEFMQKFAKENPEQNVYLHFNSLARDPFQLPDNTNYFPGHWLYGEGSQLSADIDPSATTLSITDTPSDYFVTKGSFKFFNNVLNDDLAIVPLDSDGNKIWQDAEYVYLKEMDDASGTLTVQRGYLNSTPRSFTAGKAVVLPLATDGPYGQADSGNNKLWVYNMSSLSPKDAQGRQASDILVDEIESWFSKGGGQFEHFKGIAFDLPFWDIAGRKFLKTGRFADTDADGTEDGGMVGGVNVWQKGERDFYVKLRARMGDSFGITADAQSFKNQRGVDILDGMESEGVVNHSDGYKGISSTLNSFTYWQKYGRNGAKLNYTFYKDNSSDTRPKIDKARFGLSVALALGVRWGNGIDLGIEPDSGYSYEILDELLKGDEQEKNWLGQPVSEIKRTVFTLPDLLNNAGLEFTDEFASKFGSSNASVTKTGNAVTIESFTTNQPDTSFTLSGLTLPAGVEDVVLVYSIKALSPLMLDDIQTADSPYRITMKIDGAATPADLAAKEILGYVGAQGEIINEAYIRQAGQKNGQTVLNVQFKVSGAGQFMISDVSLREGVPGLAREFEHGAVLSNPSTDTLCFDLTQWFPGRKFAYLSGKQDPLLNSGQDVENDSVCVPPINGVVLRTLN